MKIADICREMELHLNVVILSYRETAYRVEPEVIDKLCILFRCEVRELLEYVSDETRGR